MAKNDLQDPRKRRFFEEILEGFFGLVRKLNRDLHTPSAQEQKSAAIEMDLEDLQVTIEEIAKQEETDRQYLVKLIDRVEDIAQRLERLEQKRLLKRLRDVLIIGTLLTLRDALVEYKLYHERLMPLIDHIEEVLAFAPPAPLLKSSTATHEAASTPTQTAPTSLPEPLPTPTVEPTTQSAQGLTSTPATGLEPELIFIPGGRFLMGSDMKRDPDAFDHELPQHKMCLGDFHIAKYPVTNVEYKRFLDATGYHMRKSFWKDGYPYDKADHPVVWITWHDAAAYCRWLSKITGKPYRLPSEAEWEKAARGEDGRIYPWGNEWDLELCNIWVYGTGGTTPVGAYPGGASPYGCADMVGNVWEWTRSLWGKDWSTPDFKYPYDAGDGREDLGASDYVRRVLRGASFNNELTLHLRCAYRCRDYPRYRRSDFGFRVCVAPLKD